MNYYNMATYELYLLAASKEKKKNHYYDSHVWSLSSKTHNFTR